MKKIIVAISALIYLVLSSGLIFSVHYCMGKRTDATMSLFSFAENNNCECGSGKKPMDCCKSELQVVKAELDQQHSPVPQFDLAPQELLLSIFTRLDLESLIVAEYNKAESYPNPPPSDTETPVYLRNRVFRL